MRLTRWPSTPHRGQLPDRLPGGTDLPGASNLNFVAGQTIPNLVMVPLGPGNTITFYNMYGTVNVLADLVGYYK